MHKKLLIFCVPVGCLLFACLLFLLLGAGCERKVVAPEPEEAAIPPIVSQKVGVDLAESDSDPNPNNVALFGTVVSVENNTLIMEIAPPETTKNEEMNIAWSVRLPGLGDVSGKSLEISIDSNTIPVLQEGDLASLELDMPIMVCGKLSGNSIAARFVVDGRVIEMPSEEGLNQVKPSATWREVAVTDLADWKKPIVNRPIFDTETVNNMLHLPATDATLGFDTLETLEFEGHLGSYAWLWDSGALGITFIHLLLVKAEMDRITVTLGFGTTDYNFPFSFEADEPSALVVGKEGDVRMKIHPLPHDPSSFYMALGFSVEVRFELCIYNIFELKWECTGFTCPVLGEGWVNKTNSAAPMPGQELDIPALSCPGIDVFNIPGVDVLGVQICLEEIIEGDYFESSVKAEDSLYLPLQPGWDFFSKSLMAQQFDGSTSKFFEVKPATNPLNVTFDEFSYRPNHAFGVYFAFYLGPLSWPISPTIPLFDNWFGAIPTFQDDCPPMIFSLFDMFFLTCGEQPEGLKFTLPVVPVITSLTSPDTISRYGDMVTLHALVRGANGPGTSPKQVKFYKGNTLLSTEPINAQDVATYQTSTLNPCKHVITAKYVGYDDQGNTYPTEKSLTLIVTGDAEWTRLEGYWQHQYRGNGKIDFGEDSL